MKLTSFPLAILALLVIVITSCSKDDEVTTFENDLSSTSDLKSANTVPNFRVGLQFADAGGSSQVGEVCYTSYADDNGKWSDWASDLNFTDPDVAKLYLEVTQTSPLEGLDFRLGFQGSDHQGNSQYGTVQYTPWASEGGGTTALVSDGNNYDPDAYRVIINTRKWTSPRILKDFRLGLRMYDNHGKEAGYSKVWTPWATQGGGPTSWAADRNGYDPDGFKVTLEVDFK